MEWGSVFSLGSVVAEENKRLARVTSLFTFTAVAKRAASPQA